jgi:hypothetical protein
MLLLAVAMTMHKLTLVRQGKGRKYQDRDRQIDFIGDSA